MSNIIHDIKSKLSHSSTHPSSAESADNNNSPSGTDNVKGKERESDPTYSILPHPAKTNDPADLQPSGGLRHGGPMEAFHARDPYVPSEDIKNNMPAPASREELQARQGTLRSDVLAQEMPGHGTQQGGLM